MECCVPVIHSESVSESRYYWTYRYAMVKKDELTCLASSLVTELSPDSPAAISVTPAAIHQIEKHLCLDTKSQVIC